jgi:hypothetical protein
MVQNGMEAQLGPTTVVCHAQVTTSRFEFN